MPGRPAGRPYGADAVRRRTGRASCRAIYGSFARVCGLLCFTLEQRVYGILLSRLRAPAQAP
ncbi:hypothetical protein Ssi03_73250 [Sphaerisporangium siamense]|nr:hypothetical protein Ssi03_73250 [Sphaerisporangium siamense]